MTPNEILRDFRTKYQGCFVWAKLPNQDKEVLCTLDAVKEDRDRQAVLQLSSDEFGKIFLNFASTHELRFKFPNIGSFQYGRDSFVIVRRAPHRQYQRGFCAANHWMYNCASSIAAGIIPEAEFTLPVVAAAFEQKKYRGFEALSLLKKGKHRSIALDGMFSMTQPMDEGGEMPFMFMGNTFIGKVKDDLTFVPCRGADIYQQEAQRALTDI